MTDVQVFHEKLKTFLYHHELVLVDGGYPDAYFVLHNFDLLLSSSSTLRARHETFHARIKSFKVLGSTFRHDLGMQGISVRSVENLRQTNILHDKALFQWSEFVRPQNYFPFFLYLNNLHKYLAFCCPWPGVVPININSIPTLFR